MATGLTCFAWENRHLAATLLSIDLESLKWARRESGADISGVPSSAVPKRV